MPRQDEWQNKNSSVSIEEKTFLRMKRQTHLGQLALSLKVRGSQLEFKGEEKTKQKKNLNLSSGS